MSGWIPVNPGERRYFDLEREPVLIKTDSELGSGEQVGLRFFSVEGYSAGGLDLIFSSTAVKYRLYLCTFSWVDLPISPPSDSTKQWKVSLDRSTSVTVVVHCNDVEVLRLRLSDALCKHDGWWNESWSREVAIIQFKLLDTASDFFRSQSQSGNSV